MIGAAVQDGLSSGARLTGKGHGIDGGSVTNTANMTDTKEGATVDGFRILVGG